MKQKLLDLYFLSKKGKGPTGKGGTETEHKYDALDAFLKKVVDNKGMVDYALALEDRSLLDEQIEILRSGYPGSAASSDVHKAYWINVYNVFTLDLVMRHYPISTIKRIGGSFKSPWQIDLIEIAGSKFTLEQVEHEILRGMNDPRVHFALNCSGFSCPVLHNEAYKAEVLEEQLEAQSRLFVNDPLRNKIEGRNWQLSKIFSWFQTDLGGSKGVENTIRKYYDGNLPEDPEISYDLRYDWKLNIKVIPIRNTK